jgi:hypothetical protein
MIEHFALMAAVKREMRDVDAMVSYGSHANMPQFDVVVDVKNVMKDHGKFARRLRSRIPDIEVETVAGRFFGITPMRRGSMK